MSQFVDCDAVVHDDFHAEVLDSLFEKLEVLFREMRGQIVNFAGFVQFLLQLLERIFHASIGPHSVDGARLGASAPFHVDGVLLCGLRE